MKRLRIFIRETLSGGDGWVSAKRVALFMVLFTFLALIGINEFIGKDLEVNFKNQLFNVLVILIAYYCSAISSNTKIVALKCAVLNEYILIVNIDVEGSSISVRSHRIVLEDAVQNSKKSVGLIKSEPSR